MNIRRLNFHGIGAPVHNLFRLSWAYFAVPAVDTIPNNPVDGAHTGNIVSCTNSFAEKPVSDLPSEHCWVRTLVFSNFINDGTCCYLRLASPDYSRLDGTGLVESAENLAHASVRNPQLTGNVTWPNSALSQLNNSRPNDIGKRSSIHEQASKLVYPAMSYEVVKELLNVHWRVCFATKHHIH